MHTSALLCTEFIFINSGIKGGKVHESGHMAFYSGSSHLGGQLPYLEAQPGSHLASLSFTSTASLNIYLAKFFLKCSSGGSRFHPVRRNLLTPFYVLFYE